MALVVVNCIYSMTQLLFWIMQGYNKKKEGFPYLKRDVVFVVIPPTSSLCGNTYVCVGGGGDPLSTAALLTVLEWKALKQNPLRTSECFWAAAPNIAIGFTDDMPLSYAHGVVAGQFMTEYCRGILKRPTDQMQIYTWCIVLVCNSILSALL